MAWVREHEMRLTGYALERLAELEPRGLALYGPRDPAPQLGRDLVQLRRHPRARSGVDPRYRRRLHPAGHHCTMPLMEKMGWPATARASFYIYNTEADIDALC